MKIAFQWEYNNFMIPYRNDWEKSIEDDRPQQTRTGVSVSPGSGRRWVTHYPPGDNCIYLWPYDAEAAFRGWGMDSSHSDPDSGHRWLYFWFKICFVKNSPERVTKYQWLEVDSDYNMCEHQLKVDVAVFDMMLYDEPNMAMWVHAFVMCVRYRKQRQCALAMMSKPGGI